MLAILPLHSRLMGRRKLWCTNHARKRPNYSEPEQGALRERPDVRPLRGPGTPSWKTAWQQGRGSWGCRPGAGCRFHAESSVQILSLKVIGQNILFSFSINIHTHAPPGMTGEWIFKVLTGSGVRFQWNRRFYFPYLNYLSSIPSAYYFKFKGRMLDM